MGCLIIEYSPLTNPEFSVFKEYFDKVINKTASDKFIFKEDLSLEQCQCRIQNSSITLVSAKDAMGMLLAPLTSDVVQWIDFAYSLELKTFLEDRPDDPAPLFLLHEHLKNKTFILNTRVPTLVDLLLFAVLYRRFLGSGGAVVMSSLTETAKSIFRVCRWVTYLAKWWGNQPLTLVMVTFVRQTQSLLLSEDKEKTLVSTINGHVPKPVATSTLAPTDPVISLFGKVNILVGLIEDAVKHPSADRLFVETVHFGKDIGTRTVVSGLVGHIPLERLQGALAPFVINLKPAMLCKVKSEAMILVAKKSKSDIKEELEFDYELLTLPSGVKPGDRLCIVADKVNDIVPTTTIKPNDWDAIKEKLVIQNRSALYDKHPLVVNGNPITTLNIEQGIIG